ncbi:Auxin-responsive protein IAA9 [Forsythia ovata]|uniref:Auxin-responsive protein IAA9 n=1 Tax=Forsythia ovata TaxID=205694 RepID=A0ABD1W2N5_9LAMI
MPSGAPPPISPSLESCPMEHPLLGVEGSGRGNAPLMSPSASIDCNSHNGSGLKERNYVGLSDCSSVGCLAVSNVSEETQEQFEFERHRLRLGLPGSRSPERGSDFNMLTSRKLDEK